MERTCMTGQDLIDWIITNNAEKLPIIIGHRDSGGSYRTAERLGIFQEPTLVEFSDEGFDDIICTVKFAGNTKDSKPNGIML